MNWKVFGLIAGILTAIVFGNDIFVWAMTPSLSTQQVEPPNQVTQKDIARPQAADLWIAPSEVQRFDTMRQDFTWKAPGGIVAIRGGMKNPDGTERFIPLSSSYKQKDGWIQVGRTEKFWRDPEIWRVLDFIEASVPPNCPGTHFTFAPQ